MGALAGRRVLVTRPRRGLEGSDPLVVGLEAEGADVLWLPALEIVPPDDLAPLDAALRRLSSFQWVVFTSQNGVDAVAARLAALGLRWGDAPRAAAVGRKTAAALARHGHGKVSLAPSATATALAVSLAAEAPGQRFLWPRAQVTPAALAADLRAAGAAEVCEVAAYQARPAGEDASTVRKQLREGAIDAVVFASARSLDATLDALGGDDAASLRRIPRVCIGPVTASACLARGLGEPTVADDSSVEGLVHAIRLAVCGR